MKLNLLLTLTLLSTAASFAAARCVGPNVTYEQRRIGRYWLGVIGSQVYVPKGDESFPTLGNVWDQFDHPKLIPADTYCLNYNLNCTPCVPPSYPKPNSIALQYKVNSLCMKTIYESSRRRVREFDYNISFIDICKNKTVVNYKLVGNVTQCFEPDIEDVERLLNPYSPDGLIIREELKPLNWTCPENYTKLEPETKDGKTTYPVTQWFGFLRAFQYYFIPNDGRPFDFNAMSTQDPKNMFLCQGKEDGLGKTVGYGRIRNFVYRTYNLSEFATTQSGNYNRFFYFEARYLNTTSTKCFPPQLHTVERLE